MTDDTFVFQSRKGQNRPINRQQAWSILREAYQSNELDGKLGTHSMRKTFADRIYDRLGRDRCLALYERTGAFLQWPPKVVDEALFLESIILSLFEPGHVNGKQE